MKSVLKVSAGFLTILCTLTPTHVAAQAYPVRPVRLIVPFPPGGSTDIIARVIGQKLGESLGQQFVIDNRPGAGGNIGAEIAAKSQPDGYSLILVTVAYAINPGLRQRLQFDPAKDLTAIALVASAPNLLVTHPSVGVSSLGEFVAIARRGPLHYASAGNGTPTHLAAELFNTVAGTRLVHVPYKGGGPALTDLVAGQVKVMFPGIVSGLGYVKSGRLKAIGVTAKARSKAAPDIPTIAESGYADYEAVNWYALLASARTAQPVIEKLNAYVNRTLQSPEVIDKLARDGAESIAATPAAAQAHIVSEIRKWRAIVARSGAAVD